MEKCKELYVRLQSDLKNFNLILPDKDFSSDESMAMFALNILMKKELIKSRDKNLFLSDETFEIIAQNFDSFDDKTKKTIWLYFDLFVRLCEKYTKEQTSNLLVDTKNTNIEAKMSEVSGMLEDKLGVKMNAGMEDMVGIIAKEVQKELQRGNHDMQAIIKNVMEKVIDKFKEKIDNGEIDVDELQQSAETLMSQIGNPAALFGGNNTNNSKKSHLEKRKERRERLRKKLNNKNK